MIIKFSQKIFNIFKIDLDIENRVFGLDLMRFVAIFWVLILHGNQIIVKSFPNFPTFGIIDGVDIFFVLSGFLIGSILIKIVNKENYGFKETLIFWKRRWFRTLPNYYFVLFITLVYTAFTTNSKLDFNFKYLFFFQNFITPQPDFLSVVWSLAVEEWFYFLFPLGVFIVFTFFKKLDKRYLLIFVTFIFIIIPTLYRFKKAVFFATGEHPQYIWIYLFRNIVVTRLDSLMYGILGAFVKVYFPKIWNFKPFIYFILGCILLYFVSNYFNTGYLHYVFYFSLMPFSILLMVPFLDKLKHFPKFLSLPITYISIISYSMYLIHYSLIIEPILKFVNFGYSAKSVLFYFLFFILTILFSNLIYKYFEKPMMDLRDKKIVFSVLNFQSYFRKYNIK
jgi:peptidoglycan/LPS O-acetylase OafA/YrhL